MQKLIDFIQEHINDDVTRLILDKAKWPDIDIETAAASIESRRKLRNKVDEWNDNPNLIFPVKLSAEQCSSTATGLYKSQLIKRISESTLPSSSLLSISDLTGGLGVDTWFFSKIADKVHYHEMQERLCTAAKHNFGILNASNITIRNIMTSPDSIDDILSESNPDIVYMDPARRGDNGKKVFLIQECTPDVLELRDPIFRRCRHIVLKLSPMADITMACQRLGASTREVHIVATAGECKELLIWMDREWEGAYSIHATELPGDYPASIPVTFSFKIEDEKNCNFTLAGKMADKDTFLFEPGKALMKAGCFNLISKKFCLEKIGRSTHYYLTSDPAKAEVLKSYGKVYKVLSSTPLDKRSIKAAGAQYPHSEVTARNIPMDTETLRKKLGVTSGDDAHIFGLKSDSQGNILVIATRL